MAPMKPKPRRIPISMAPMVEFSVGADIVVGELTLPEGVKSYIYM